jgi:predicted nucleic acid-binding protein
MVLWSTWSPLSLEPTLRQLTQMNILSPQLWQDAYRASFALASGLHLATFDRSFQQFPGLRGFLLN